MFGVGAAGFGAIVRAEGPEDDLRAIEEQGRKAGLGAFRSAESRHYRVIGDAPEVILKLTLRDCEAVAADFLDYYGARNFGVRRPPGRLTAVVLADPRAYAAFVGKPPDLDNGGRYDRVSNRLTTFDYRPTPGGLNLGAGFLNRVFLAHEATHQLCFNAGLLDRSGDVPKAISEGLAEFGEVRKPDGPSPPGRFNGVRLNDIARKRRLGVPWIPVARLLAADDLFDGSGGLRLPDPGLRRGLAPGQLPDDRARPSGPGSPPTSGRSAPDATRPGGSTTPASTSATSTGSTTTSAGTRSGSSRSIEPARPAPAESPGPGLAGRAGACYPVDPPSPAPFPGG